MANKPKTMLQIRKIIQLLADGYSERQVSRLTFIHRNTVRSYHLRIKQTGKQLSELFSMGDAELSALLYSPMNRVGKSHRIEYLESQMEYLVKELTRTGVTRKLLWEEYLLGHPEGYSYAQFCEHLTRYNSTCHPTMHLDHIAGNCLQFDFAGKSLYYLDPVSNAPVECPVLVSTLPYSGFSYMEPLASARLEHLIPALNRSLEYIGGVPRQVLTDNMTQIVKRSCRYEPAFTEMAEQWAVHNNTALKATRVGKPKDKPSVEKSVDLIYQQIYARMRNDTFYCLDALCKRTRELLDEFNLRPMYKHQVSRRERFEQEEKALLRALPAEPYSYKHKASAKVKKNYHVILGEDWHQYSVPHQYIARQVDIIYDDRVVEIFLEMHRIAVHRRNFKRNGYTTLAEHMPESHRRYLELRGWSSDDFTGKAALIGEYTSKAMTGLLSSRTFIEQTYDACLGVLRLADKYGNLRLEQACKRASQAPRVTYRMIRNILENNLDKALDSDIPPVIIIPEHENVRGPEAYF